MKANVTIKALSAAVLGLAGMAFAGSALADCPAGSNDPGANWSGRATTGSGVLGLEAPGMKATACKMASNFSTTSGLSAAAVIDNTPANETRYRFRFYVNADAITPFSGLQSVQLFTANAQNPFPAVGGTASILRAVMTPGPGGVRRVSFVAGTNDPGNSNVLTTPPTALVAGENWVEGEILIGAAGTGKFNFWVNSNVAGTPTGSINLDNVGWVGVDTAILGMAAGNATFRTAQINKKIYFDEFDSRRQTFIGQ